MIDIEKLLAGRKAIEDYREAHSKLHLGRVKADGTIIPPENVSARHAPLLDKMLSRLKALGFNSIDEFMEANDKAVLEDMKRCVKHEGKCDLCPGRVRGCDTPCYEERTQGGNVALVPSVERGIPFLMRFKDYYATLPPRKKGRRVPLVPNCSITNVTIEDPSLDWEWR